MNAFSVWFTRQLPKPKSVLIVHYAMLNQIDPCGSSNSSIHKTSGGDRSEKRDNFLPRLHSYFP